MSTTLLPTLWRTCIGQRSTDDGDKDMRNKKRIISASCNCEGELVECVWTLSLCRMSMVKTSCIHKGTACYKWRQLLFSLLTIKQDVSQTATFVGDPATQWLSKFAPMSVEYFLNSCVGDAPMTFSVMKNLKTPSTFQFGGIPTEHIERTFDYIRTGGLRLKLIWKRWILENFCHNTQNELLEEQAKKRMYPPL